MDVGSRIMLLLLYCLLSDEPTPFVTHHFYDEHLNPITRLQASTLLFGNSLFHQVVYSITLYLVIDILVFSVRKWATWSLAWYLAWRVMKTLRRCPLNERGRSLVFMESRLWVELWQMSSSQIMEALITKLIFWVNDNCSFHSYSFPPSCNQMKSFPSGLPLISSCFFFSLLLP